MQEYQYVYEIYRTRSFSKAAKNLYVSQPALSATIKKIEERLGCQLFERTTTSIEITKEGEAYIDTARKIMDLEEQLRIRLDDLSELKTGSLILAGTAFFSSYILPPIVKEYQKRFQNIKLEFEESDSLLLYRMAEENNVDLIVDAGHCETTRFEKLLLYQENIILAVPDQMVPVSVKNLAFTGDEIRAGRHLLENGRSVDVKVFQKLPFLLLKKEHDLYQRAMEICGASGFEPRADMHLNQLLTAYNLTRQGFGISFVSDSLVRCMENENVSYFLCSMTDKEPLQRDVFVAYRKNRHVSKAMHCFIDLAQEIYRDAF
jgi:DNA-binding transcriptional LysR family regulator